MICSFNEIKNKEVIDIDKGEKLGFVDDIEVDTVTSSVRTLTIYGRKSVFSLYPKEPDIIIKCSEIKLIGTDTILVSFSKESHKKNDDDTGKTVESKRIVYKNLFS